MQKHEIRAQLKDNPTGAMRQGRGQIAEILRKLESYRRAKAVFVSPGPLLAQARMNAMADGKFLLCPSPGIKEGFLVARPFSVPFAKLSFAATAKGMRQFGVMANSAENLAGIKVGLMIGYCEALDTRGLMIGDGSGFFDLSCAIFQAWNVLEKEFAVIAVVGENGLLTTEIEADKWDCFADKAIVGNGVIEFSRTGENRPAAEIYWQELPERRIRKLSPLWKLLHK